MKRLLVLCLVGLQGCVSAINLRNANVHADAGYAAIQRGDWDAARRQFAQAVVNADLGGGEPGGKAVVNYEYGRALGVACYWDEAEKYLLRSKQFDEERGQSPYLTLYELGLKNEKQGKPSQAASYFAQLIPLMEKEGLRTKFPLGAADAYDRYAEALEKIGNMTDAAKNRSEANAIRLANPNAKPFGRLTPYGTLCQRTS